MCSFQVRILVEAFKNKRRYLSHNDLSPGMTVRELNSSIPSVYTELSGEYDDENTWKDMSLIYNRAMFVYRTTKAEAHQWMLHIVAEITGLAILSVWPLLPAAVAGNERALQKRAIYNRIIFPLDDWRKKLPVIAVLWCNGARRDREPDHFTPLVP